MLRVIHSFDVKPGVIEHSFIEWLDGRLDEITKRFGCLERKTWAFIDGIHGDYEKGRTERRPKYLNEAFWPDQEHADRFRQWLLSEEGKDFRRKWFSSVVNHTVLRYVEAHVPTTPTEVILLSASRSRPTQRHAVARRNDVRAFGHPFLARYRSRVNTGRPRPSAIGQSMRGSWSLR